MHKSILASFLFLTFAILTTFAHASDTRQDQQTLYLAQKRAAYWKSKRHFAQHHQPPLLAKLPKASAPPAIHPTLARQVTQAMQACRP